MRILFYGRLGEMIGREVGVDRPPDVRSVADLRQLLASLHPAAAQELTSTTLRACVGDSIVGEDFCIRDAETVEFFPALSGG